MIRELIATLWDTMQHGDLRGHLRHWWWVYVGQVTPDTQSPNLI